MTRKKRLGRPDLPLLSVNLPVGVVVRPTDSGRQAPSEDLSGYQVVNQGDLVVNQLGKPHGALGVSKHLGIISPAYFVAEFNEKVEPLFMHHLLRTRLYISEYERRGKFMPPNQFDISWDDFRDIELVLPPRSQQRAIADYLDRETARIDALIEKKQSMISLLEKRFESSVFACVTYGLDSTVAMRKVHQQWVGQIPEHWGMPTVSMNFDLQLGKMLNAESAEGPDQYPYLRNANVQWDRFDFDDLASMHFSSNDRQRCELKVGDVLVCEGGEVGRSAVWTGNLANCYFQKAIHRVRPRSNANGRFLMYCLRAAAKQSVFSVEGNTSTIVHLTSEQLAVHRFPWPPFNEQAAIVEVLDAQTERLDSARSVLRRQVATLSERRQTLITAMVTGELEISEVAA
jgi:type I restriction enzyme S subunit